MRIQGHASPRTGIRNPRVLDRLVSRPAAGWLWLPVRLYVGWQWLWSGWHKLTGPGSVGWIHAGVSGGKPVHQGDRLLGFWQHAIAPTQGERPQVAFDWYRD